MMRLLIRPAPAKDEGLRAYVCRLATRNRAPTLFRPMLDSMYTVTKAVPDLVDLTGEGSEALLRRGSVVRATRRQASGVRFGDVVLPRKVVRVHCRSVCPMCLAERAPSRCVWELSRYDVCDRHGLKLIEFCSACQQPLSWAHPSADRCACGFPLAQLEAKAGPSGRRQLCKVLAASMLRTIHGGPVSGEAGTAAAVAIDWTLVLCEFIAGVLLPIFGALHGLDNSKRFHAARDALTATMLEDQTYRDYLRDAVFMYASADPMTLVSALRPGRLEEWKLCRNEWCWSQLCFHQSLWNFLRKQQCRNAQRCPGSRIKQRECGEGRDLNPVVLEAIKVLSTALSEVPVPAWRPAVQEKAVALVAVP